MRSRAWAHAAVLVVGALSLSCAGNANRERRQPEPVKAQPVEAVVVVPRSDPAPAASTLGHHVEAGAWSVKAGAAISHTLTAAAQVVEVGLKLPHILSADDTHLYVVMRRGDVAEGNADRSRIYRMEHDGPKLYLWKRDRQNIDRVIDTEGALLVVAGDRVKLVYKSGAPSRDLGRASDAAIQGDTVFIYRRRDLGDDDSWEGPMVIERVSIRGTKRQVLATLPGKWDPAAATSELTIAGGHLYWLAYSSAGSAVTPHLARVPVAGGDVELLGELRMVDRLGVLGDDLFVGALTALYRSSAKDRELSRVSTKSIEDMSHSRAFLFAAGARSDDSGAIYVFGKGKSQAAKLEREGVVFRLTTGGGWLYWLEYEGNPAEHVRDNRLLRLPLSNQWPGIGRL